MDNHIKVYKCFGHTLDSREAATLLFERYKDHRYLYLDFAGVDFMSRSFADQFIKESKTANYNGTVVELENIDNDLKALLTAVEKTQQGYRKDWLDIPKLTFHNKEELYQHLQTI
ncbi:hypothetical protein GCM10027443_00540 [Pontibacter brevis]